MILPKKQHSFLIAFIAILSFLFPMLASAQNLPSFGGITDSSISVIITPQNPEANKPVTLTLESSSVDLGASIITWKVNGTTAQKGKDLRRFTTTLQKVGTPTAISIIIDSSLGVITKNITITPTQIDILYESASYTPPFFAGKALPPSEATITLWAVPNFISKTGKTIDPNSLSYTWRKNGDVDQAASGLGKSTYTYRGGRLAEDSPVIEVSASSANEGLSGSASFQAPVIEPKLLFYENNPLLGVRLNKKLPSNINLGTQEMTVVAYPYYMGGTQKDAPQLQYQWKINGSSITASGDSKAEITIRKPNAPGQSVLSLTVDTLSRIMQTANASLTISYGQ